MAAINNPLVLALLCSPLLASAGQVRFADDPGFEPRPDERMSAARAWTINADSKLRTELERWCSEAGWTLLWESQVDYPTLAGAEFNGADFEAALRDLSDALEGVAYPLTFEIGTNRVLRVTSQLPDQGGAR